MEAKEIKSKYRRHLTSASAETYYYALRRFCRDVGVTPSHILDMSLEDVENLTEDFILDNREKIAPKTLNVIYNAVKTWLYVNRKIKSRRQFREITFDKTSTLSSPLMSKTIEAKDMRKMISMANGEDSVILGFYGLMGLRPSIIAILKVKHIHPRSYTLKDGKIQLKKPPMIVVPAKDEKGRHIKGNKAKIDFISFIPSRIAEILELNLNREEKLTLETPLTQASDRGMVWWYVKKCLRKIGKEKVSTYRLRNFADYVLDRMEDVDLKEFMMGHKGSISAVYQFRGLPEEKEARYRQEYVKHVDSWIDQNIFGSLSDMDRKIAMVLSSQAESLGVPKEKINEILRILESGKMTLKTFQLRLNRVIQKSFEEKLEGMVKRAVSEELPKALEEIAGK